MTLEDYITKIAETGHLIDGVDYEFLSSIYVQLHSGRTLTTRQGYAICNVMKKIAYQPNFKQFNLDKTDLLNAISEKRWKTPLRVSVTKRKEARYLGDNIVALSLNSSPDIKTDLKPLKPFWYDDLYIITVTRTTIEPLIDFLGRYGLEIDQPLEDYLALCLGSKKQISHFIAVQDGAAINICDDELLANYVLHMCGGVRI